MQDAATIKPAHVINWRTAYFQRILTVMDQSLVSLYQAPAQISAPCVLLCLFFCNKIFEACQDRNLKLHT